MLNLGRAPRTLTMMECVQPSTNLVRYNMANRHFGVANQAPDYIRTFYRVGLTAVAHHGGHVGFFQFQCARTDV